jgi:hypothetical protein
MDLAYLRSAAAQNLSLKLLAFGSSLLLYSWVHGSQEAQRTLNLNVDTAMPDKPSRVLTTPIPPTIRVTVRGPKSTLDSLRTEDIPSVLLDIRKGSESRVTIDPSMIPAPPGLKVEQIDPPAIDLVWEDVIGRDIPVEVGVVSAPAPGYVLKAGPNTEPTVVRATGPKSEVMVIQRVRAEAFDLAGLTEGTYTRQLAIDRPHGRVAYDAQSVSATVEVGREVAERLFPRMPLEVIGRAGARAHPADVDVRLTCPPEVVRALRVEQIVPRVQVTGAAEHGSDAPSVQLSVDQCDAHVIPSNVVVRW